MLLLVGVSSLVRFVGAAAIHTPLYFPDEYVYSALAYGFAHGHLAEIRGAHPATSQTVSYFAPVLLSPIWRLSSAEAAYRLSQAVGCVSFSLAALPAFALARRAGTSPRTALLAAGLSLAVPAGVFSGMVMPEPYAYLGLLVATLIAVDALEAPSPARLGAVVVAAGGLILVGGLQFGYFLPVVLVTGLVTARSARLRLVTGAAAAALLSVTAVALVFAGDVPPFSTIVELLHQLRQPAGPLAAWLGIDAFLLTVAAGWVVIPGALLGLAALARSGPRVERIVGTLSLLVIAASLAEAADWSTKYDRTYERLAFYAVPFVLIGFARWLEREGATRAFSITAYACAGLVILVPLASQMHIDGLYAPPLTGLAFRDPSSTSLVWAPALGLLAAVTGLAGQRRRLAVAAAAGAVAVSASLVESLAVVSFARDLPARALGSSSAAYITTGAQDPFVEMRDLFWNPSATRLLLVGGGAAPDGFPSTAVRLAPNGALVELDSGRDVGGPFIVGHDALGIGRGTRVFTSPVRLLAFGWYADERRIGPYVGVFAAGGEQGLSASFRLWSTDGAKRFASTCSRPQLRLAVGVRPAAVPLAVPPGRVTSCALRLIGGTIEVVHRENVAARATVDVRPGATGP